jgi:hypothetical protein
MHNACRCIARIIAGWGVVFALLPLGAHANGLMVAPPDYWVNETTQEAVIFFEGGHEEMILAAGFEGSASDFAWIVPTPSIPTVTRGSWEIFSALRDITEQTVTDPVLGGYSGEFDSAQYIDREAVQEIERQTVAYYDIAVLNARTTESLLEWFAANGFVYPENSRYVLEDYINAGWYFTAIKLNTDNLPSSAKTSLTTGRSIPLHFSFDAERMVFPMQLSQVGAHTAKQSAVGVTLYLLSDRKRSLPGFTQQYAGYISAEAISELSYATNGEPLLLDSTGGEPPEEQKYVITKLYRSFPVAEMTYDLYPREEENVGLLNEEGKMEGRTQAVWIITGVGGIAVVILVATIAMMNTRTKTLKE